MHFIAFSWTMRDVQQITPVFVRPRKCPRSNTEIIETSGVNGSLSKTQLFVMLTKSETWFKLADKELQSDSWSAGSVASLWIGGCVLEFGVDKRGPDSRQINVLYTSCLWTLLELSIVLPYIWTCFWDISTRWIVCVYSVEIIVLSMLITVCCWWENIWRNVSMELVETGHGE